MTQDTLVPTDNQTDSQKLAILNAQLCEDKIANNVIIIDLSKIETAPSEYFVICTIDSGAQADSICDLILRNAKNYRLLSPKVEGREASEWVLIDFFDVVVHIMNAKTRKFYKIEKLWGDADFYTVDDEAIMHPIDYDDVIRYVRTRINGKRISN